MFNSDPRRQFRAISPHKELHGTFKVPSTVGPFHNNQAELNLDYHAAWG